MTDPISTPLTDAEVASDLYGRTRTPTYVKSDFARDLERKLSVMTTDRDDLQAENGDAYGKGVSAGKQEALNYTSEERESYGKHVAANDEWKELRVENQRLRAFIGKIDQRSIPPQLWSEWREILKEGK